MCMASDFLQTKLNACVAFYIVFFKIAFHGIDVKKEELILDGSEAPLRIDAEALLASENLSPAAVLNKVKCRFLCEIIITST